MMLDVVLDDEGAGKGATEGDKASPLPSRPVGDVVGTELSELNR